jgi:hypothetical protein
MQLVVRNWANFQLHVSHATGNQLHKTVAKCQISSSVRSLSKSPKKTPNFSKNASKSNRRKD